MREIEILQKFNQDFFEFSSSEEEIVLLRSKWDLWDCKENFIDQCREFAWGDLVFKPESREYCQEFCNRKSDLLNGKIKVNIPEYAKDCLKVCEDWNSEAIMWKEKSFYYMLCWSTTA